MTITRYSHKPSIFAANGKTTVAHTRDSQHRIIIEQHGSSDAPEFWDNAPEDFEVEDLDPNGKNDIDRIFAEKGAQAVIEHVLEDGDIVYAEVVELTDESLADPKPSHTVLFTLSKDASESSIRDSRNAIEYWWDYECGEQFGATAQRKSADGSWADIFTVFFGSYGVSTPAATDVLDFFELSDLNEGRDEPADDDGDSAPWLSPSDFVYDDEFMKA